MPLTNNNNHNSPKSNNVTKNTNKNKNNNIEKSSTSTVMNDSNDGFITQKNKRNLSDSSSNTTHGSPATSTSTKNKNKKLFKTWNRFDILSMDEPTEETTTNDVFVPHINNEDTLKPPPPVFVRDVLDYTNVYTELINAIGVDNFFCKSSADHLKIQTVNTDSYRTLVRYLKEQKAKFHTYQLKEDKPIRVVIRNLHPTTRTKEIKEELEVRLFEVRRVTNVLQRTTRVPLPLFFVDLEPTPKSSEIFQLSSLFHTKIKIEEPYKPKSICQCNNCQEYGHTKTYCSYPSRCGRCSGDHPSSACPIPRETPPKCANCSGVHPASYKGCSVYRELQRSKKPFTNSNFLSDNIRNKNTTVRNSHPITNPSINQPSNHVPTYAQATSGEIPNSAPNSTSDLKNFLGEFKSLIEPLISLLNKLITKLLDKI